MNIRNNIYDIPHKPYSKYKNYIQILFSFFLIFKIINIYKKHYVSHFSYDLEP